MLQSFDLLEQALATNANMIADFEALDLPTDHPEVSKLYNTIAEKERILVSALAKLRPLVSAINDIEYTMKGVFDQFRHDIPTLLADTPDHNDPDSEIATTNDKSGADSPENDPSENEQFEHAVTGNSQNENTD